MCVSVCILGMALVYVYVSGEPGGASCPIFVPKTRILLFFFCTVTTYIQVCECLTGREGGVCVCMRPQSVPLEILPVLMPLTYTYPPVSRCRPSGPPRKRRRSPSRVQDVRQKLLRPKMNGAPTSTLVYKKSRVPFSMTPRSKYSVTPTPMNLFAQGRDARPPHQCLKMCRTAPAVMAPPSTFIPWRHPTPLLLPKLTPPATKS